MVKYLTVKGKIGLQFNNKEWSECELRSASLLLRPEQVCIVAS